jgi:fructokinase
MSFLVVGESLVDLIGEAGRWRFTAVPGGSPLNVAAGLAAAGHPVRLASEVGDDLFGGLVRSHLAGHGVDLADLAVTAAPTSLAVARLDRTGAAGYDFRFGWTWAGPVRLEGVSCLHVGSLGALVAPGAAAVREVVTAARSRGIAVSYDPNLRPALAGDRTATVTRVERMVSAADLVKASRDDLAWLYPDTPDLAAARRWAGRGPGLVVVTRGGDGAVALHDGHVLACAAPPVEVVDTVGAGDAFTTGLLSSLARSGALPGGRARPADAAQAWSASAAQVAAALQEATATATASCTRRGAAPPGAERVRALSRHAVLGARTPLR